MRRPYDFVAETKGRTAKRNWRLLRHLCSCANVFGRDLGNADEFMRTVKEAWPELREPQKETEPAEPHSPALSAASGAAASSAASGAV